MFSWLFAAGYNLAVIPNSPWVGIGKLFWRRIKLQVSELKQ